MRPTFVLAVALAAVAAGLFAGADAQGNCKGLIPDLEAAAGNLGITQFVSLLKELNAVGNGAYTIFAPDDGAISGAVQSLGVKGSPSSWTDQQKYIVTNVLLYHIAPGNLPSKGISKFGASVSTLANNLRLCTGDSPIAGDKNITDNFNSLSLKVSGKTVTIVAGADTATVTAPDQKVPCQPNVIVHKIDKVLLPCDFKKYLTKPLPSPLPSPSPKTVSPKPKKSPALAAAPAKCPTGSTVFKALSKPITGATILPALLKSILQPEFVGTVFVPSDASLMQLSASLGVTADSLSALQKSTIFAELLSYHVVPTTIYNPTAPGTKSLTTLLASNTKQTFCTKPSKGTLQGIDAGATVTIKSATASVKVLSSELTCTGAIHVIDGVLLPCNPPANIQALLKASNSTPPATTTTTGSPATRSVTLVGSSPAPAPSPAPVTSQNSAAASLTPSALLAVFLAPLLAQLL